VTRASIIGLCLAVELLAGCATPPRENFYTLSADAPSEGVADRALPIAASVVVGPVSLPELVDRPQLVVRIAANQVVILEQQRWAGPLKSEIARVIAENLGQLLGTPRASADPENVVRDADYRVLVDVQSFESVPGEQVAIDALWSIRRRASGDARIGRSTVRERTGGAGYDAVAGAHSRALANVSRDIAQAVRALDAAGR
jgi:uncharacterized lipoprotein YmbA